jgi:hypothetical protein
MLRMDELHGILIAYEMRTMQDNSPRKEETFKESNKTKNNKKNPKSYCSYRNDLDEDEEMANFTRKLKKGIDKYKCKLPFKYFNRGKIGHFCNKCPYDKKKENDEE